MSDAASIDLPPWAQVSEKRRGHIARVTALLEQWARAMRLDEAETAAWRDAGLWHDALRDAPEAELRALVPDPAYPPQMLHGPAVARRLEGAGERRTDMLSAIRWHTVGAPDWGRLGRALYMADFLEPGRKFMIADRRFLADHAPHDFDGVFRQVVRMRIEWSLREGNLLYPETVALWNSVR
jgi:2-amino-4-hydroxy-6-hydroxymethyldihydropteridine diphosphokinase